MGRFDANCYIHLHGRQGVPALLNIPPGALVVAINSDGLFTLVEQQELANSIPDARLVVVESTDGHDGFLLGWYTDEAILLIPFVQSRSAN